MEARSWNRDRWGVHRHFCKARSAECTVVHSIAVYLTLSARQGLDETFLQRWQGKKLKARHTAALDHAVAPPHAIEVADVCQIRYTNPSDAKASRVCR